MLFVFSRTGKNLLQGKNVRVDEDGYPCFEDYFSSGKFQNQIFVLPCFI